MKTKIKIKLVEWISHCADGCCTNYGTKIYLNDELLNEDAENSSQALKVVLKKLGYEVEIKETFES